MSTLIQPKAKDEHALEQIEAVAPNVPVDSGFDSIWAEIWHMRRLFGFLFIIYLAVITVGTDTTTAGLVLGVASFRRQFGSYMNDEVGYVINATYTSIWSGVSVGAQTFGALAAGYVADVLGRRWALRISAICVLIASGMMIGAREISLLIVSKGVLGFGVGFLVSQSAPYLAECAPVRLRGIIVMGINVSIVFGQWLATFLIWACSVAYPDVMDNRSWIVLFGLQFIFPTLFLVLSVFLPESPVFLVQRGRIDDARDAARKLYGDNYDHVAHIDKVILDVQAESETSNGKDASYMDPCRGTDLRRTMIGILVIVGQVLTGNLFVMGYQNYFYELAHIPGSNALTVGSMSVALFGNLVSYFFIDTIGRRPLYVSGAFGLGVANFLVGFMDLLRPSNADTAGKVAVFGMYLYSFTYQITIGPSAWALVGEIPSNRLRAKTNSWVNMANSLFSFGVSYAIPQMFNPDAANLGLKMGYVFGGLSMVLGFLSFLFVPETKNRTNWDLDRLFEAKVPARKFASTRYDVGGGVEERI